MTVTVPVNLTLPLAVIASVAWVLQGQCQGQLSSELKSRQCCKRLTLNLASLAPCPPYDLLDSPQLWGSILTQINPRIHWLILLQMDLLPALACSGVRTAHCAQGLRPRPGSPCPEWAVAQNPELSFFCSCSATRNWAVPQACFQLLIINYYYFSSLVKSRLHWLIAASKLNKEYFILTCIIMGSLCFVFGL